MSHEKIAHMRQAHKIRREFPFEIKPLNRGYSQRILRIDLDKDEITILPVDQEMIDRWTGGKGFDLWLMFKEVTKNTTWESPENPICFSPGPLGGATSFPGSGKTLVTSLSPLTSSVMDCNVGGYFGPYMKFAGFDVLMLVGKAKEETIIYIDAVNKKITIETAPEESIDSHLVAEELTEMYADDDLDKRNIAVVSAGRGADYVRMGILNFSFWDWRRNVARLKQAGRGGIGTVFRNKMMKALVIKNRGITPAWRVEENKVALNTRPKTITQLCSADLKNVDKIIEKWGNDPEFIVEMMQDIQERFHFISISAIDRLTSKTGVHKAYIYHIATFDPFFSLEVKTVGPLKLSEPIKLITTQQPMIFRGTMSKDFSVFKMVLQNGNPENVIEELKQAGLRSRRCGADIASTLQTVYNTQKEKKEGAFIICNAAEGEPESSIGRGIIEENPYALIEGMLIAGYAVGAHKGYIITWKEYENAESLLQKAIDEARANGLLGKNIQDSSFDFDILIHRLGGAFVPGESSSLINVMSGKAGDSFARYIPIEEVGLLKKPTTTLNLEACVLIPSIIEKGVQWFNSTGTKDTPGTKVLQLAGDVTNPGLVEVPMGTSLRDVVEKIGGGASKGRKIKAIQLGGISGTFFAPSQLDMNLAFESMPVSFRTGAITVYGEDTCMIETLSHCVKQLETQSCGKCTPCREGLFAVVNTLERINQGEGKEGDIDFLEKIARTMNEVSLCNFGINAANPILSALNLFKQEFVGHIEKKKCGCSECSANV